MKRIGIVVIVATILGWAQPGHAMYFSADFGSNGASPCACNNLSEVCVATKQLCQFLSNAVTQFPLIVQTIYNVQYPTFECPEPNKVINQNDEAYYNSKDGCIGKVGVAAAAFVPGKFKPDGTFDPGNSAPNLYSQGIAAVVTMPGIDNANYKAQLAAFNAKVAEINVVPVPATIFDPKNLGNFFNVTPNTGASPSYASCGTIAAASNDSAVKARGLEIDAMIDQLTPFITTPGGTLLKDDKYQAYACKVTIKGNVGNPAATILMNNLKAWGVIVESSAPLSTCAKKLVVDSKGDFGYIVTQMQGLSPYVIKADKCDIKTPDVGCQGQPDSNSGSGVGGFISVQLAKDDAALFAAAVAQNPPKDVLDLTTQYKCEVEALKELNVGVYSSEIGVQVPDQKKDNSQALTGSFDTKGIIFNHSVPLGILPSPHGNLCGVQVVTIGKQEQLLWVNGDEMTLIIDPLKQTAFVCDGGQTKKNFECKDNMDMIFMGKEADGTSHLLVYGSQDGKTHVKVGDIGKIFKKVMAGAAPIIDAIIPALESKTFVPEKCDKLLASVQNDLSTSFEIPPLDLYAQKAKDKDNYWKDGEGAITGNRGFMSLKGAVDNTVSGLAIYTIGDTAKQSSVVIKLLPVDVVQAKYIFVKDAAVSAMDTTKATVVFSLAKKDNPASADIDLMSCTVPLDESSVITCDKPVAGVSAAADVFKAMVTAKLRQQSRDDLGKEDFGQKVADKWAADGGKSFPNVLMHGFEGFGDVTNALEYGVTGSSVYRVGSDGKLVKDDKESLPPARKCVVADLDNYGGVDLFCFADKAMMYLPNANIAPRIDSISAAPGVDANHIQVSSKISTEEGEDLTYQWQVFEYKGGQLVERSDLVANATSAQAVVNLPSNLPVSSSLSKSLPVSDGKADIGVSAAIGKSVASNGLKGVTDSSHDTFIIALKSTDPAGSSDVAFVAAGTGVAGVAPLDAGIASPFSAFGIEGGCTLIRQK